MVEVPHVVALDDYTLHINQLALNSMALRSFQLDVRLGFGVRCNYGTTTGLMGIKRHQATRESIDHRVLLGKVHCATACGHECGVIQRGLCAVQQNALEYPQ